jgi:hypothetical protein
MNASTGWPVLPQVVYQCPRINTLVTAYRDAVVDMDRFEREEFDIIVAGNNIGCCLQYSAFPPY